MEAFWVSFPWARGWANNDGIFIFGANCSFNIVKRGDFLRSNSAVFCPNSKAINSLASVRMHTLFLPLHLTHTYTHTHTYSDRRAQQLTCSLQPITGSAFLAGQSWGSGETKWQDGAATVLTCVRAHSSVCPLMSVGQMCAHCICFAWELNAQVVIIF